MAFQFPSNPTLDQTYSPMAGTIYSYDGTGWVLVGRAAEDSANFVQRFGDTMTGPLLHPNGTVAAPSIAFAAEPKSGFVRPATNVMQAIIDGAPIWGINKTAFNLGAGVTLGAGIANFSGALTANGGVYLPVSGSVFGRNLENTAWWSGLHMGGDNRLYIAYSGYPETIINASGVNRLHVHGSGTTFTGLIYGNLSGTAARLYSAANTAGTAMAFHWAGQTSDQPNWIWGGRDSDPANMYVWQPALLNVNYANRAFNSHRVHLNADNAQAAVTFWWDGQGGQPTWIWGVPDQSNTRLYNPANFSVNYANSTNISSYVTAHGYGQMGFHWSVQSSPHYVWGNYSDGNTYLMTPGSMSVNYANSAGSAGSVGTINGATLGTLSGGQLILNGTTGAGGTAAYPSAALVINSANSSYVPSISMHYSGVSAWMLSQYSTDFLIGGNSNSGPGVAGGGAMQMQQAGNIYARSFNPGSLVLLEARQLTTGVLAKVLKLRGMHGLNPETGRLDMCVEIDDLELEFPEVVNRLDNEDGSLRGKGINYMLLTAPIIEAIRELNERLTALENAI